MRTRPNCFVAMRVTAPSIAAHVEWLQRSIVHAFPDVASCLVDSRTLHVTLCVLLLRDDDEVERASRILAHAATELASQCFSGSSAAPTLDVGGWRFFPGNSVLYSPLHVDTEHGCSFVRFAAQLHALFRRAGMTTERFREPFTPHVTLWKTTTDRDCVRRVNAARHINSEPSVQDALHAYLVARHAPLHADARVVFGSEPFVAVELLSMRERAVDGFYKVLSCASVAVPADVAMTEEEETP